MKKNSQHVVHNPKGGWGIKKAGSPKFTKTFDTQKEAIDAAISISKNQEAELSIHGRNGRIREKRSYGNDPCPPLDKD